MDDITTKEVKFVNDPKNLSALAKIHEISNKAKERKERKSRVSPNHINHIRVNENLEMNKNQEENFSRRKSHFPTMVYPGVNSLLRQKELNQKGDGLRKSNKEKEQKGYKSEFVWDKKLKKLEECNLSYAKQSVTIKSALCERSMKEIDLLANELVGYKRIKK